MSKIISFDLSDAGIQNAQKQINNIIKQVQKQVNIEFISLSLDWIKNRAIQYLNSSGLDAAMIQELQTRFVKNVFVRTGHLILDHEKGAYIEFGVGIEGSKSPYPNTFAEDLYWEYDVDSNFKTSTDRSWRFILKTGQPLDIKPDKVTMLKIKNSGDTVYSTTGSQGILFMYNAIMDYANNISIPGSLYETALNKIIGG